MPGSVWPVGSSRSMKIVIIGGSAQSTPALFAYLGSAAVRVALRVTLAGRNESRLRAVTRAARLLMDNRSVEIDHVRIDTRAFGRALDQADVVVWQLRAGGYAGRAHDERFPLQYEVCGDE